MPAASCALLSNLPSDRDRHIFVACFLHSSAHMYLYQTPGRRPPRITGRFVNNVTRGWVGTPNERAPFRFHGAAVVFVDRCLSRLGISSLRINVWLSFSQADLGPVSDKDYFFGNFFQKICAHSERHKILWPVSLKFKLLFGNIAFPLSFV